MTRWGRRDESRRPPVSREICRSSATISPPAPHAGYGSGSLTIGAATTGIEHSNVRRTWLAAFTDLPSGPTGVSVTSTVVHASRSGFVSSVNAPYWLRETRQPAGQKRQLLFPERVVSPNYVRRVGQFDRQRAAVVGERRLDPDACRGRSLVGRPGEPGPPRRTWPRTPSSRNLPSPALVPCFS